MNGLAKPLGVLDLEPLVVPAVRTDLCDALHVGRARAGRLRQLARQLRLRRANGESPAAVLCDAIADGLVVLRRADDPQQQEVKVPTVWPPRKPEPAGETVTHHAGRGCVDD